MSHSISYAHSSDTAICALSVAQCYKRTLIANEAGEGTWTLGSSQGTFRSQKLRLPLRLGRRPAALLCSNIILKAAILRHGESDLHCTLTGKSAKGV